MRGPEYKCCKAQIPLGVTLRERPALKLIPQPLLNADLNRRGVAISLSSLPERSGRVALLAALAEAAAMDIISAMTPITGHWQRDLGHGLRRVTGMAIKALVRARQRVAGLRCMIEAPACPAIGIVALGAR